MLNYNSRLPGNLIKDARIHGAQIILAVYGETAIEDLREGICATLNIPFTAKELEKCFSKLRKNLYGKNLTKEISA